MGLDINANIEITSDSDERYKLFAQILFERDSEFFALISECQQFHSGTPRPLFPDRGLPSDVSLILEEDYEAIGCDAHNPSWLLVNELSTVRHKLPSSRATWRLDAAIAAMHSLNSEDGRGSRLVFWFQ